jgi:four helix bundle protein
MNSQNTKFDLEDRTTKFAETVINLTRQIHPTPVNQRLIPQLVAAADSVAANYCEASEAESKKDFVHKISIVKKEIKESRLWLRLLAHSNPEFRENIIPIYRESQELLLIFSKIINTSRINNLLKNEK